MNVYEAEVEFDLSARDKRLGRINKKHLIVTAGSLGIAGAKLAFYRDKTVDGLIGEFVKEIISINLIKKVDIT